MGKKRGSRLREARSPDSLPKERKRIRLEAEKREMAPLAKYSALPVAAKAGSSSTRSAPHKSAICVRVHLSKMAGRLFGQNHRLKGQRENQLLSRGAPVSSDKDDRCETDYILQ